MKKILYFSGAALFIVAAAGVWFLPTPTQSESILGSIFVLNFVRVVATVAGFTGAVDLINKGTKK